jgi:7-cyano-7-deazaguanine reductase
MTKMCDHPDLLQAPLGKTSDYITQYDSSLLYPLPRINKRTEIGIVNRPLFVGHDEWNAYELSWLNEKGKPQVAIARFFIDCHSEFIIESKSFKLYLNSFNQSIFADANTVQGVLERDVSAVINGKCHVVIMSLDDDLSRPLVAWDGMCLDDMDVACTEYVVNPDLLRVDKARQVTEILYSHLLKSNCLVTGQPDWGSVQIRYSGSYIEHESLLKYVVSFRNHNEFHEQCVERIFVDLMRVGEFSELTVEARYTRRGGLDINPIRSLRTHVPYLSQRLVRQ